MKYYLCVIAIVLATPLLVDAQGRERLFNDAGERLDRVAEETGSPDGLAEQIGFKPYVYSDVIGHYSFTVPGVFEEIPMSLIAQSVDSVTKLTGETVRYDAGFQLRGRETIEYPYFFIQEHAGQPGSRHRLPYCLRLADGTGEPDC